MIRCVIVDDEPHAVEMLERLVSGNADLELILATTNATDAISRVNHGDIDLLFLDIKMPGISGLDVIDLIKGKAKVIFCTAYRKFAYEGFVHDIVDYLLKPITPDRFSRSVDKFKKIHEAERKTAPERILLLKGHSRNSSVPIKHSEIDMIESLGNYCAIHANGVKYVNLIRLKEIETQLSHDEFIRVHNSYILPIKKIIEFSITGIKVKNIQATIPVGITYRKKLIDILKTPNT